MKLKVISIDDKKVNDIDVSDKIFSESSSDESLTKINSYCQ